MMKIETEVQKVTAREMGRVADSQELLHDLASQNFHAQTGKVTSRPDLDMAYHLGYKEALQDLARLLLMYQRN